MNNYNFKWWGAKGSFMNCYNSKRSLF